MINKMATRKRQKDDLVRQNKMYQDINRLAEEIVATKHHVIKLCEMENSNREALNALKRKENFSQKCWVNMGGMFIKMNKDQCKNMIEEEQARLKAEIEKGRNCQPDKVAALKDAEGTSHVTAFNLKPLSRKEVNCVKY